MIASRVKEPELWTPHRAFAHPLFVAGLALLALNDHVLKGAGLVSPLVTGKLSDVVGLLVAPAVLAWLVQARGMPRWLLAHVLVGAGFVAVQLAPSVAAALDALAPWGARLWPDPTDLLALPALAVSFVTFGPARTSAASAPRRGPALAVAVLALVACTATSRSTPPPRYPFRPGGVVDADLYLRHTRTEELTARVLRVRDGAEIDCDRLIADPIATLGPDPFAHEKSWTLARGDAVPLWDRREDAPNRDCYAVRLEVDGRAWLLVWRHGVPPVRPMELRLEPDEPAEPDAVVMQRGDDPPRVPEGVSVRRL